MSKFKAESLSRANLISITGAGQNDYAGQKAIGPVHKGGLSNTHVSSGGGQYVGEIELLVSLTVMRLTEIFCLLSVGVTVLRCGV